MGTGYLIFMPGKMTFEQYFRLEGLSPERQRVNFALGLTPRGFQRRYLRIRRASILTASAAPRPVSPRAVRRRRRCRVLKIVSEARPGPRCALVSPIRRLRRKIGAPAGCPAAIEPAAATEARSCLPLQRAPFAQRAPPGPRAGNRSRLHPGPGALGAERRQHAALAVSRC